MNFIARTLTVITLAFGLSTSVQAEDALGQVKLVDFESALALPDMYLADNRMPSAAHASVPNIPDSAFEKPAITANNIHMYLGLASLAMGLTAAATVPDSYDADLLNSAHFRAARLSWQLGAAAVASGFYVHWDDFHMEDGLLDRDNLHVLLGFLGTLGYYMAVKGAVDEYNANGYPSTDHASKGMGGGVAMTFAIGFTW